MDAKEIDAIVAKASKVIDKPKKEEEVDEILAKKRRLRNFYRPERGESLCDPKIPDTSPEVAVTKQYRAPSSVRKKQPTASPAQVGQAPVPKPAESYEQQPKAPPQPPTDTSHIDDVVKGIVDKSESTPTVPASPKVIVRGGGTGTFKGTLHDIVTYSRIPIIDKASGDVRQLVDGEDVAVGSVLCYVNNICFGIEGDSGSGKTFLMDKWCSLIDADEYMRIGQITGQTFNNNEMSKELNGKRWVYFSEIQRIATGGSKGRSIIETLKDLAEGRPAKFTYYISRNKVGSIVIQPINACFTRALEDDWDLDRQLRRRFVVFETDSSTEHDDRANENTLRNWTRIDFDDANSSGATRKLRDHLYQVSRLDNIMYIDPFSIALGERIRGIPKSTCFVPHYGNMLRASAKYHINDRMKFRYDDQLFVVVDVEDHYLVDGIYWSHFLNTLRKWNGGLDIPSKQVEDWGDYFGKGVDHMKADPNLSALRSSDPKFIDKWIAKQLTGTELRTTDYKTGDIITFGEYKP